MEIKSPNRAATPCEAGMFAHLQRYFVVWLKAKTGLTASLFILLGIAPAAAVLAFVFLCVAGHAWFSAKLGPVFGALAVAGVFVVIAILGTAASVIIRNRTQQNAILERATSRPGVSALIDPKVLSVALQAGRTLGWQRLIPLALLGFLALQWAQQSRNAQGK
jgi:hypothetical protein